MDVPNLDQPLDETVYTFYMSFTPGPDRQSIQLPDGTCAWIRTEVSPTTDLVEALFSRVDCRPGESFMNSHTRAPYPERSPERGWDGPEGIPQEDSSNTPHTYNPDDREPERHVRTPDPRGYRG